MHTGLKDGPAQRTALERVYEYHGESYIEEVEREDGVQTREEERVHGRR